MIIRLLALARQRTPRRTAIHPSITPSITRFSRGFHAASGSSGHLWVMFDASSAAAPPPPPPPTRKRRTDGLALLLIGALLGAVIGIGAARAVVPAISGGAAPVAAGTGISANAEQAI